MSLLPSVPGSQDRPTPLAGIIVPGPYVQLTPPVVQSDSAAKSAGRVKNTAQFRRYAAALSSVIDLSTGADSETKTIIYEVGLKAFDSKTLLERHTEETLRIDASYPIPATYASEFTGLARKFSNFTASFTHGSLAAIVERLAKGLAVASNYDINSSMLRGGATASVYALGSIFTPVSASPTTVFIPRLVDTILHPDTLAVLISACAGEGAAVATDLLEVDVGHHAPVIPTVGAEGFPGACVDALQLLGANMSACDQGGLFSYALTRGIHSVLSVVGHTDEGAIMRDVLRLRAFGTPFGCIYSAAENYVGLPSLASSSNSTLACYVDSIALATAAVVAHCDPGQEVNGQWLPTVLDSCLGSPQPSGTTYITADSAGRMRAQLVGVAPAFAKNYIQGLSALFNVLGTSSVAEQHLQSCFQGLSPPNRHLEFPTIAPFFWIEPTSLTPCNLIGSDAERNGAASIATKFGPTSRPAFAQFSEVGDTTCLSSSAVVSLPFVRNSSLIMHYMNSTDGGLGYLRPRQLDPEGIIHPGCNSRHPLVRDRLLSGCDMAGYMWVRGQTPLPAPGELVNVGGTMLLEADHVYMDDNSFEATNLPPPGELFNCQVVWRVTAPRGITPGKSNYETRTAARARTAGSVSLREARRRRRIAGGGACTVIPILAVAPVLHANRVSHGDPVTTRSAEPPAPVVDTAPVPSSNTASLATTGAKEYMSATPGPKPAQRSMASITAAPRDTPSAPETLPPSTEGAGNE